jgi:trimeric autotransporter adhesin
MATIVTKNSSTASAVPTTSDLVQGELAVNVTDKRIFTENASTQIVELGTNPSTVTTATATVTGTLTANGTFASSNAVITGGSVNSTPIGASTASTVRGTTVTATTGFVGGLTGNVTGNLTGNVTGNVAGNLTGNVTGNVTASSGTTTLNDLVVNGTADFTNTKLTNVVTPTAGTDAANKSYVDDTVAAVIDSAPAALDTLNELAAALGDDANFAGTVTTALATKLPLAGGTMTGAIAMGTSKITGLGDPTSAQDAATKTYVDTADALKLNLTGGTMSGAIAMGTNKITGLGDPTLAQDAATKTYVDDILGSATSAATSAAAAATSASNAATSASNAASSATASSNSATSAAASYDAFDDRYLGSKASDPVLDNDGNALLTGALYFNSTSDDMKVYTGSTWKVTGPNPDSPVFVDTVTAPDFDLDAIAETKAVTAVDVFVYDTSKDSDGGAWRKRTQNTSWYNETLDTATRGSRKEFPAVAVIVAEAAKVTIYDGDDPSLPMWMVFNYTGYTVYKAEAHQGKIAVATNLGLSILDFAEDDISIVPVYNSSSTPALAADSISSVKFVIEQNAEASAVTGLLKPTYFLGINGYGVQRLRWDDSVLGNYGTGEITRLGGANERYVLTYRPISTSLGGMAGDTALFMPKSTSKWLFKTFDNVQLSFLQSYQNDRVQLRNYDSNGVSELAIITSNYNTGWMVGDIKGAFLSDTDDTDVTGSGELVTNGDFETGDLTGWTPTDEGVTVNASNQVVLTTTSSADVYIRQENIPVIVGKTYNVSVEVVSGGGSGKSLVRIGDSANYVRYISGYVNNGISNFRITPVLDNLSIYLYNARNDTYTVIYDNISVKLIEVDRSVKNNHLIVNGTITKTPVATGADLVGYSGFSTSNYLQQPYNSDLDFGTGDFSVMGWVKEAAGGDWLIDRMEGRDGSSNLWGFDIWQEAQSLRFDVYENNGVTAVTSTTAMGINDGVWNFFTAVRRSGVLEMYMHGKLAGTTSGTARNISYTSTGNPPPLTIGAKNTGDSAWVGGSAALIRISATAPTAEQIAKIYNDEKFLFQENSQATLYGSSDAVTALAYDDDTELLHVGTSAGRSVFNGLRRVDNTTGAVGVAISASNNFIVEE